LVPTKRAEQPGVIQQLGRGLQGEAETGSAEELSGVKSAHDAPGEDNYELSLHLAISARFTALKRKIKLFLKAEC